MRFGRAGGHAEGGREKRETERRYLTDCRVPKSGHGAGVGPAVDSHRAWEPVDG